MKDKEDNPVLSISNVIFELASYSFKESGNITLTITENHTTNKKISIQVK